MPALIHAPFPGAFRRRCLRQRPSGAPTVILASLLLGTLGATAAVGQELPDTTRITISGIVVDRWSGQPIPNALVRFADTDFQARTDAQGEFTLGGILRGSYLLLVNAPGYTPQQGTLRVIRTGALQIPMDPTGEVQVLTNPPAGPGTRVLGRVVEMESGRPLEGAEVSLGGMPDTRITDSNGRFEFASAPAGWRTVSVTTLGRAPLSDSVQVAATQTVEMEIHLAIRPVEVDPMVVIATPRNAYLEDMGYYHRR
ncbi:MAG: carboxypeptidase regulatory-like domain-containing protein, partial [Longimicrobiales bacterium]